jgi:hypothetical protein
VAGDARADYLIQVTVQGALIAMVNIGGDAPGINGWVQETGIFAQGGIDPRAGKDPVFVHLRFADVSCDGRADYLAVSDNGAVRAFINQGGDGVGQGWLPLPGLYARGFPSPVVRGLRFADVDGDGRADYLLVHNDGSASAFLNQGGDPP